VVEKEKKIPLVFHVIFSIITWSDILFLNVQATSYQFFAPVAKEKSLGVIRLVSSVGQGA
jgi:hypothetical protein